MRNPMALWIAASALVVALPGAALAAEFQVKPTTIELDSRVRARSSGSVTVINRSREAVRFQVKVMAWDERADGQMVLDPTTDVVVYPSLFTIAPGDSRAVRVATAVDARPVERTYRVFVEELPPLKRHDDAAAPGIRVLTRMAIPVFVAPTDSKTAGAIDASVVGDQLRVVVRNQGSVRVRIATIRVLAGRRSGAVLVDRSTTGWYLLAGGRRAYDVPVQPASADALEWIRVEVTTDRGVWKSAVSVVTPPAPDR